MKKKASCNAMAASRIVGNGSSMHGRKTLPLKWRITALVMTAIVTACMTPMVASADQGRSGFEEVKQYAISKDCDEKILDSVETIQKSLGRDIDVRETIALEKCIDAQMLADEVAAKGRAFTSEELELLNAAGEAVFGTPGEIIAANKAAMMKKEKSIDLDIMPATPDYVDEPLQENAAKSIGSKIAGNVMMPEIIKPTATRPVSYESTGEQPVEPNVVDDDMRVARIVSSNVEPLSDTNGSWTAGGSDTEGIGAYPTKKGKILVTLNWAYGLLPTGHAAIVYDGNRTSTWGVIESLSNGVTHGYNNWGGSGAHSKQTCYGLDVIPTSDSQEASVAEWCRSKIGLPYNYNYLNKERTDAYYCSQLVWQGYKTVTGVDIDTSAMITAVHPSEFISTDKTKTIYRHGTDGSTGWVIVNDNYYYLYSNYSFAKYGWQNVGGTWYYFTPTGEWRSPYQTALGVRANLNKRAAMPNSSTTPGTQPIIWQNNGLNDQRWTIFDYNGAWYIQNRNSNLFLAVPNGNVYNGAPVIQWTYTGGNEQKWRFVTRSDNYTYFCSVINQHYCIAVPGDNINDGSPLILWPYYSGPEQQWGFMDQW